MKNKEQSQFAKFFGIKIKSKEELEKERERELARIKAKYSKK